MAITAVTQNSQAAYAVKPNEASREAAKAAVTNDQKLNTQQKPALDTVTISKEAMQLAAQTKKE